jgi:1-acyl-sn-glycerol-3-phosphate acyltransferase
LSAKRYKSLFKFTLNIIRAVGFISLVFSFNRGSTLLNLAKVMNSNLRGNSLNESGLTEQLHNSAQTISDRPKLHSSPYQFGWFDWFCLWYPPGWLILFNRHWQHYHSDPDGWRWWDYALFLIPGGFYLALLLRWLRLGCRAPQASQHEFEPTYQQAFQQDILLPILKHHFRAELHQVEHLPQAGPLIIAMNHAGMCFPWDMIGLDVLLSQTRGWVVQPLAHGVFFDHPWLKWWLPVGWSQALGGIRAERESFEDALQHQDSNTVLLYAPEGWHGLAKGWRQRYRLTTFDPSFIRLSDRYRIPIVPIACIGNEWLHPWTININRLARRFKLPMFPISVFIVVFILFPSMGVWANRTNLRYYVQPTETPWTDTSIASKPLQTRGVAYRVAQTLRSRLQAAINRQCQWES